MGLDYSYKLYFHRQNLWDVLQGIASLSEHSSLPSLVSFPDYILTLSMQGFGNKEKIINHNNPEFGFMTSIYFPPDQEIKDYLLRVSPEYYGAMSKRSSLGFPIGYIYLNVYNDLRILEDRDVDPNLVMIDFSTPGTTMSILFFESLSIRRWFENLLEDYHGVCGVLNLENDASLIWLNGQRVDEWIPDPYMFPKEIEEYLRKQ